jgi:hypothetical protein
VLGAAARRLIFTRGGDIVFRMAGDHARFASGTAVKIYYQSPLVRHVILPALLNSKARLSG